MEDRGTSDAGWQGGARVDMTTFKCVWYELLLAQHRAGRSANRAGRAVRWRGELLCAETVQVSEVEEGLGCASFVAGTLH